MGRFGLSQPLRLKSSAKRRRRDDDLKEDF
jgi:hypothetical protein